MKNGRWQAKDIDDVFFLRLVEWMSGEAYPPTPWPDHGPWTIFPHWIFVSNLERVMPFFPTEVIVAEAAALIRRGLLEGCRCGCRGDFELTQKGHDFLARQS